jgi:predicted enzyme related to lactoylglutathione lyase
LTWHVADLDDAHSQLQTAGVEVTEIRPRWDASVFYCHDPEGHRIELWSERI